MFAEGTKLVNFRFPLALLEELEEAKHWLRKESISALVRESIREYLDRRERELSAHRRAEKRVKKAST